MPLIDHGVGLILLGAPGAGKGTQAERLAATLAVPHISTGDILREAVRRDTELGAKAQQYMDSGRLVPDDLIIDMVRERLVEPDTQKGFLLDGFPRTVPQAEAFEAVVQELGVEPIVVAIEVDDETLVERLSGRRICEGCDAIYHVSRMANSTATECDRCGGTLVQRADDQPGPIRERLRVYKQQTQPLKDFYRQRRLLHSVDGSGAADDVAERILTLLEPAPPHT